MTPQVSSVWGGPGEERHTILNEILLMREREKKKNILVLFDAAECESEGLTSIGAHHGSKHLSGKNPQRKMFRFLLLLPFFFFSQLELTFSLAVNETKQRRVIRVDVFIRGFCRKLIS